MTSVGLCSIIFLTVLQNAVGLRVFYSVHADPLLFDRNSVWQKKTELSNKVNKY